MGAFPARKVSSLEGVREEVLRGLRGSPRTLPPTFFHDARTAELQVRLSEAPEYYLLRAEMEILRVHAADIARLLGPRVSLLELGSAGGARLRLLLDALDEPAAYVPIHLSGAQLAEASTAIDEAYPALPIVPVWADFTSIVTMPAVGVGMRQVAFLPGSTLGRFHPAEAAALLRRLRGLAGPRGAMVLGVDLRKDPLVLHAAYNDSAGVAAALNLHQLTRLNRELDADFDLTRFRHYAFYEPVTGRVELHLVSLARQTVTVAGERIGLEQAETIWTASDYKYGLPQLETVAHAAGFGVTRIWTDGGEGFAVAVLE